MIKKESFLLVLLLALMGDSIFCCAEEFFSYDYETGETEVFEFDEPDIGGVDNSNTHYSIAHLISPRVIIGSDSRYKTSPTVAPQCVYEASWVGGNGSQGLDYAIIQLKSNIARSFYFSYLVLSGSIGNTVAVSGYPGDNKYYQMTSIGKITNITTTMCYYNNDTFAGMSGAPVYNGTNVVAIHTGGSANGGYNYGVRITGKISGIINALK